MKSSEYLFLFVCLKMGKQAPASKQLGNLLDVCVPPVAMNEFFH
jgi:hypothetical protein